MDKFVGSGPTRVMHHKTDTQTSGLEIFAANAAKKKPYIFMVGGLNLFKINIIKEVVNILCFNCFSSFNYNSRYCRALSI